MTMALRPSHWLWVMTSLVASGVCTAAEFTCANTACLSLAILAANSTPEPDTIHLQLGTYNVIAAAGDLRGPTGLPVITSPIRIRGNRSSIRRDLSLMCGSFGQPSRFRLFGVASNGKLTLEDLGLQAGCSDGDGGAVLNDGGTLELIRVSVAGNRAGRYGGGVASLQGSFLAISSTFFFNKVPLGGTNMGGGLFVRGGQATLNFAVIERNESDYGGGIAVRGAGDLSFNGLVTGNHAGFSGAGFFIEDRGLTRIAQSRIIGNTAEESGGGLTLFGAALEMSGTTLQGNSAPTGSGGAVMVWELHRDRRSFIKESTIEGNLAVRGGGISVGGARVGGWLEIANSTIFRNRASRGGGVFAAGASLVQLTNVTMTGNTAIADGDALAISSTPSVRFANTIVGGDGGTAAANCSVEFPGVTPPPVSFGYNLAEDTSCGFTAVGDRQGLSAGLLPFTATGDPGTGHFPLGISSPARDAGDVALCSSPELRRDQLRHLRDDGRCDIGSIEFIPPIVFP